MKNLTIILSIVIVVLVAILFIGYIYMDRTSPYCKGNAIIPNLDKTLDQNQVVVTDFNTCISAGNPAMESYPRQCRDNDKTYTEYIGNELEKADFIQVSHPRPNQIVTSPLKLTGQARIWYFEGDFPVKLLDAAGNIIARKWVTAQEDWMTENPVTFVGELEFTTPTTDTGTLIFEKDNPSGIEENADQLVMPVRFR